MIAEAIKGSCLALEPTAWSYLEALVNQDSFPEDIPGLDAVVEMVHPRWEELGFDLRVVRTEAGLPVLICDRVVDPAAPTVMIMNHLDTVFPPGTAAERPFALADGRATGPGVADMKGGVIASWMAVSVAIEAGFDGVNLRILNNTDEEASSLESRPIIEEQVPDIDLALVFEPGRPEGSIVTQRRGIRRYRVEVTGKPAHTGVEPWAGRNAIVELAHKILDIAALDDRDRFLSVTPVVMSGGSRVNIVPEKAVLDVDVRIPDIEAAEYVEQRMREIVVASQIEGTVITAHTFADRPPMVPQPIVEPLAALYQSGARALGYDIPAVATGGGSDGCFVSALGVPVLDALGPVGGGYHTADEFVRADSLVERASAAAAFLVGVGKAGILAER